MEKAKLMHSSSPTEHSIINIGIASKDHIYLCFATLTFHKEKKNLYTEVLNISTEEPVLRQQQQNKSLFKVSICLPHIVYSCCDTGIIIICGKLPFQKL